MTDYSSDGRADDLRQIAELIAQSSLGSPGACDAIDQVSIDQLTLLRDRMDEDGPPGRWQNAATSAVVCRELRAVVPNPDGQIAGDLNVPGDGSLFATNGAGDVRELDPTSMILPGKAQRALWRILWLPAGRFLWRTTVVPAEVTLASWASRAVPVVDVVVLWHICDHAQLARSGERDLDQKVQAMVALAANRSDPKVPTHHHWLAWKVEFIAEIERIFASIGLAADVIVKGRLSANVRFPADAQILVKLMSEVTVHGGWADPAQGPVAASGQMRVMLAGLGSGVFVRHHVGQLAETLRVLGLTEELALTITVEAFSRLSQVWDLADETDRLPLLATATVHALTDAGLDDLVARLIRYPALPGSRRDAGPARRPAAAPQRGEEAGLLREATDESGRLSDDVRIGFDFLQESRYEYSDVPLA